VASTEPLAVGSSGASQRKDDIYIYLFDVQCGDRHRNGPLSQGCSVWSKVQIRGPRRPYWDRGDASDQLRRPFVIQANDVQWEVRTREGTRGRVWDSGNKRLGTEPYSSRYMYARTIDLLHRPYLLAVPLQRFSTQTDQSIHTLLTCTSKKFKEFLDNQALVTDVLCL